jgi:hypothetical protein
MKPEEFLEYSKPVLAGAGALRVLEVYVLTHSAAAVTGQIAPVTLGSY